MTEKFIINQNGEIEDTMTHITFDSFMEILIVLNGQSRQLNKLWEENEQLKQQLFKVQKWLKILHDEHCPSLATIDGVLTEIDKAVNGDK